MTSARVVDLIDQLPPGDVFTWGELVARSSHAVALAALEGGHLVRPARGRYCRALPPPPSASRRSWSQWDEDPTEAEVHDILTDLALARAYGGVLAGLSAARAHGWMTLDPPGVTTIVIPRDRRCPPTEPGVRILRRALPAGSFEDHRTTPLVTCLMCAADLPFEAGLAVADSALRARTVGPNELREAADIYRGRGAVVARRVAAMADGLAENPFESSVRVVASQVSGLEVAPQVPLRVGDSVFWVDLADTRLRVVIEADSYEFHGSVERFAADIERYNALTAAGFAVIRVTWRQVRRDPHGLRELLATVVAGRQGPTSRTTHIDSRLLQGASHPRRSAA